MRRAFSTCVGLMLILGLGRGSAQAGKNPFSISLPGLPNLTNNNSGNGSNANNPGANVTKPPDLVPHATGKGLLECLDGGEYHAHCNHFELAAHQQEKDLWCWAASVQMISIYNGVKVTQPQVVERVKARGRDAAGDLPEEGAIQWEVMNALCPRASQQLKNKMIRFVSTTPADLLQKRKANVRVKFDPVKFVEACVSMFKYDEQDLVPSICAGRPVLLSMKLANNDTASHMLVVYDVTFKAGPNLLPPGLVYTMSKVTVEDPWTGKPKEIDAATVKDNVDYMMSESSVERSFKLMQECFTTN